MQGSVPAAPIPARANAHKAHGCAQDGGFKPLAFLLSEFLGFLFVLLCLSLIPAAPPSLPGQHGANRASTLIPDAPAHDPPSASGTRQVLIQLQEP